MATEEFSVGYNEGYDAGWNAAQDERKPWVGLTDQELMAVYESEQQGRWGDHVRSLQSIEAKLKEKNDN